MHLFTLSQTTFWLVKEGACSSRPMFMYLVLQVYKADTDHYVKQDKYWGRELNEEGFKGALYHFFHNGFQLRNQVIRKVITRLEELRRAIERQSSYRFYAWWVVKLYILTIAVCCCDTRPAGSRASRDAWPLKVNQIKTSWRTQTDDFW